MPLSLIDKGIYFKEEKQKEVKQQEQQKVRAPSVERQDQKEKPAFSDQEMFMFNEKKVHHKKGNDIKDLIEGVTKEIETIEESGHDDLGL